MPYARVSREFIAGVKLFPGLRWHLARQAGLHPSVLSKLVSGAEQPRIGDPRVIAVGRILGLTPRECFEGSQSQEGE
jgi:hypothetical protein